MVRMICLLGAFCFGAAVVSSVEADRPFSALLARTGAEPVGEDFRGEILAAVNELRGEGNLRPAAWDGELQDFLARYLREHGVEGGGGATDVETEVDLEDLFDALQAKMPEAQYLDAHWVGGANRPGLLETLRRWEGVRGRVFDRFSAQKFAGEGESRALVVMAGKLRRFSPEAVNEKAGRFFQECPHCREVHALEMARKPRTVVLSCPECGDPFELLAADTRGNMRRATDFFTGFALPGAVGDHSGVPAEAGDELDGVLAVWRGVARRCRYEADGEIRGRAAGGPDGLGLGFGLADAAVDGNAREIWKTPEETWRDRRGDCEDTSLLLADALISAGYRARVAIGRSEGLGPHAWCVVEAGGGQFVLESTWRDGIGRDALVPVAEAARFYRPRQLFDRERLYIRVGDPETAAGDCFRESDWKALAEEEGI